MTVCVSFGLIVDQKINKLPSYLEKYKNLQHLTARPSFTKVQNAARTTSDTNLMTLFYDVFVFPVLF